MLYVPLRKILSPCAVFIVLFVLVLSGPFNRVVAGNDQAPLNPRTIPEYDTIAGVVMYWNPGSNHAYDQIVASVVNGIQPRATVFMQTNSEFHQDNMISAFGNYGVPITNIEFIDVYGDRIWIRDHGPFSIYDDGHLAFVGFNDLAANHGDQDLPERLADYWNLNYYDFSHIIFDGGNFLVDSHNRLFATDRLYTNNPGIPESEIDAILQNYLGIDTVFTFSAMTNDYWGHLDMQIKLLDDTTFIISTVDTWHPDYQVLQDNYQALQAIEHPEGKTYRIEQIPKADNWKTYINSLIVNDAVLVPTYSSPRDAEALSTYADLMPGKEIIGIDANAMIHWEGAIHCITNHIPPFEEFETGPFQLAFDIEDGDGQSVSDAVIELNGIEYPPGEYVFEDLEAGLYQYIIFAACYQDAAGSVLLTDEDILHHIVVADHPGDANDDGVVDVLDVLAIVQYYAGQNPEPFCFNNSDINQDGIIDLLDVISVVSIISQSGERQ